MSKITQPGKRKTTDKDAENERLPIELGWQKKEKEVTLEDILATTAIVRNATSLLTSAASSESHKRRMDLHAGSEL